MNLEQEKFNEPAKVFLYHPGQKYPNGTPATKAHWLPKYNGKIRLEFNHIVAEEYFDDTKTESTTQQLRKFWNTMFNHEIQPNMELFPGKNCDRSWVYSGKVDKKMQTFAIRFKSAEVAQRFKFLFDDIRDMKRDVARMRKMKRVQSTN